MSEVNILIAGVGGQGTLLASKIIGNAAIANGYDVKVSEVHGMSQRGGSVVTYVRYGKEPVQSPIIDEGGADIVLAFEMLEACRAAVYLKKGGTMIINNQKIPPMPVITGQSVYPDDIIGMLAKVGITPIVIDALNTAKEAGSEKAVNVAVLGETAKHLQFPKKAWLNAITASVKPQYAELNKKAFEYAYTDKA